MREIRTSGSEGRGWKRAYGSRTEHHRESEWTYAPDPTGTAPPPDPTTVTAEGFGGSVGAEFLPREQVEQEQAALRPCFRGARVAGTAA